MNVIKKMKKIKADLKYYYLKNMKPEKYELFLKKEYKKYTGEKLNLKNPKKYTEKMQFAKLYLNSSLKSKLTDKYLVRGWVEEKIGEKYLIPLLGVYEQYSEINFEELPERFVLKTNHSSGWNLIVKNKEKINHKYEKKKFDKWMSMNFAYYKNLQLHYNEIEPKIIAEEFLEDSTGDLKDYKFLCFNGKVYYCWVDIGRYSKHYRNIYDMDWNLQPFNQNIYLENSPEPLQKPEKFEEMAAIAEVLCQGFSHVRVDLYDVDGRIYFGEMTFTNGSGYELVYPEEYNYALGDLWNL